MPNLHKYYFFLSVFSLLVAFCPLLAQTLPPPMVASPVKCELKSEELVTLIGKKISQSTVQDFLNYCYKNTKNSIKSNESSFTLLCNEKGLQVDVNNGTLERITIFGSNSLHETNVKISCFEGCLFKNLYFEDNRATTLRKLGKPAMTDDFSFTYRMAEAEVEILFKKQITKIILTTKRCISGDCKNGFGVFVNRNGDKYEGNWKGGVRNGKGIALYANGDKYDGIWLHDLPNGQGTKTYQNGANTQKGIWERGVFKGEFNLKNDQIYGLLGKHKSDEEVRIITENYGNGYYIAQLRFDHQEYKFNNGKLVLYFDEFGFILRVDVLKGGVFEFMPSLGKFMKAGADQKQVAHLFGEPTDKKEITDKDHKHYLWIYKDSIYHQEFYFNAKRIFQSFHLVLTILPSSLTNKLNGQCLKGDCNEKYGEMISKVGRYRGTFKDGFFTGKGRLAFTNGGYYSGRFKNNLRNGYGFCQWTDLSYYRGRWKNNVFQGLGTRIYVNKDRYEGDWKNGKRNGYGKMRYADGTIYMGYWKDDLRNGKGILQQKNGRKKAGKWKDDELEK